LTPRLASREGRQVLEIIRPNDSSYPDVRDVYTATGSPAAVIRPRSAVEVAEALLLARQAGGPVSIRSGGHGVGSISTNVGGTVIDLGELNSIKRLDPGGRLVRIGPGARWGDVASALRPWDLALSSGDSGDVGVGGLGTSGGIGLMGRAHGLTIDNLVAAETVTADGEVHLLDAERQPDLFWAVRGAGANFGIVTSLDFRAARVPAVVHASLQYQVDHAAPFLHAWGETVEAAPREVSAFLYLTSEGFALATVVFADADSQAAERAFEPFRRVGQVLSENAALGPYAAVLPRTGEPHRGQQPGHLLNGFAVHLDEDLSDQLDWLLTGETGKLLQVRSVGGAINDVPAEATAFAHRHQNFSIAAYAPGPSAVFDARWETVRSSLDGIYLNFETAFSPRRLAEAFPPATLRRLRDIKRKVDPDNVFNQNFPVE
jgi:FAD/FMN-containing dehydrogenase